MARTDPGSLSKELPLKTLDDTISAIVPGMPYTELLRYAAKATHRAAPGLLRKRFLLLDSQEIIVYDRFLTLAGSEGLTSPRVRKVMYFLWAFRDFRLRDYILRRVADSEGIWSSSEITKKSNADFFQTWFRSSAPKVRSNIEFFFIEAGILKPTIGEIQLDLDDNWLPEAMQVAAQHEEDPALRRAMCAAPLQFIVSRHWNGLANATIAELLGLEKFSPAESDSVEDLEIKTSPKSIQPGRSWSRREPKPFAPGAISSITDSVKRERANRSHWLLEKILADAARMQGYEPMRNEHMDLYFKTSHGSVLAEVKSCHGANLHSQIRRGLAQLYEYRFLYSQELGPNPTLLLVIETIPPSSKVWLAEFLSSVGIILAWKEHSKNKISTSTKFSLPAALRGVIHST